ncbi:GNAT family N-acetyltransferase [Halobacterium sp. KA-4]|jgi:RimJ/RimL family protein N-acetyltransferase|uniref:GNAT family N-acetyltransferase n=1 Tax=Halobacterium sp. KA-4 TaxID=2896367 RepID=UPI001E54A28A|nr:GNAT family protein [Halobacterium sp. KA-4]MCD2198831.1 GNAT family N-acetyltransferase [Halobacterium sp. KA-4]
MPGRPFLEGDAVDLCAVAEDDLEFLRETLNDPAVWPSLSARTPLTAKQEREWYEEHASADNGSVDFVVAVDDQPIGSVGVNDADDVNGSAEVGLFLAEEFWGNGYGTEAGRLVTQYAFAQHRRHRVVARVFEHNDASARIWEKLGFELEGTHRDEAFVDGEYRDVRYYSVLEDEWNGEKD